MSTSQRQPEAGREVWGGFSAAPGRNQCCPHSALNSSRSASSYACCSKTPAHGVCHGSHRSSHTSRVAGLSRVSRPPDSWAQLTGQPVSRAELVPGADGRGTGRNACWPQRSAHVHWPKHVPRTRRRVWPQVQATTCPVEGRRPRRGDQRPRPPCFRCRPTMGSRGEFREGPET